MTFKKKVQPVSAEEAPKVAETAEAPKPTGEQTIIVPPNTSVTVSDPSLVQVSYLRVVAIREGMWRGKIKHTGTKDWKVGGPNPELTQEQLDAIWEESRKPKPGLSVSEITKFEPAAAE